MTFFDWWSYLGTFVQSFYSWTTYNAGQFNANIGWRQAQQYQKKNYSIAWITVARDDIRDMMSISVNRINNYMVVATLILSVAAGAIVSISVDQKVPDHVVYSVYISIGSSVTFLMLSILFGVKGQNTAFTRTMKLLTYQMRPEPSAEYSHNYMKQAQWLERGGMAKMFRFPGIYPEYDIDSATAKANQKLQAPSRDHLSSASIGSSVYPEMVSLEDATPIETLEIRSQQTTYLAKFANFMQFWLPYDVFAKYTMGMGVIALGQGSAYFALAQLIEEGRFLVAVPMVCLSATFLITVIIVIQQNYKSDRWGMRIAAMVTAAAGNIFATISAINRHYYAIDAVCIPLSYLSHAIFYTVAPCVAQKGWSREDLWDLYDGANAMEEEQMIRESLDGTADGRTPVDTAVVGDSQDQWEDANEEGQQLLQPAESSTDERAGGLNLGGGLGAAAARMGGESQAKRRKPTRRLMDAGVFHAVQTDDFGPSGDWGMTQDRYKAEKQKTQSSVMRTVRYTLIIIALIWYVMFIWSTLDAFEPQIIKADYLVQPLQWEDLAVEWPSLLFRPTRLACMKESIFVADSHNIFEIVDASDGQPSKRTSRIQCSHSDPIVDITADCLPTGCYPLVLVRRPTGQLEVVNCSSGQREALDLEGFEAGMIAMMPLAAKDAASSSQTVVSPSIAPVSQASEAPLFVANKTSSSASIGSLRGTPKNESRTDIDHETLNEVLASGRRLSSTHNESDETRRLLVAQESGQAMQAKQAEDASWRPEWPLGSIGDGRTVGVAVDEEVVLTFRSHSAMASQYSSANHFMAVLNRTNMQLVNRWAPLYKDMGPVSDGCSMNGGQQALVLLTETNVAHGSKPPKLVSVQLTVSKPYRWILRVE
mmetsp:Transcript_22815/g.53300  ORF Transcript_22815/g.53300 Transcript_22815/m.53300 type:complete len:877 (+) Transcript_22815:78-2708(+)